MSSGSLVCRSLLSCWIVLLLAPGCVRYRPSFTADAPYFARVKTQEQGALKVSVVGLGAEESKKTFGVDMAKFKILPVWLKIENNDPDKSYFFLERSIDPHYYPAGEAAYAARIKPGLRLFDYPVLRTLSVAGLLLMPFDYFFVQPSNDRMREAFAREAITYGWIGPRTTKSGFVFVPFEMGVKEVTIDLYSDELKQGREVLRHFDFFIDIPGIKADYRSKVFENLYPASEIQNFTEEEQFKEALEKLPPCVTNRAGTKNGDPVNLVVVGTLEEILEAFTTAEWDETEAITLKTMMKMADSFLSKGSYDYSPVSPLYLYGRSQDIALQKARGTINERMHLRLWCSPMRFNGKSVWVGQASRDIGVRFTTHAWNLMTHKIDPDIDESAIYVMTDLIYRHRLNHYGVVAGGIPRTPENPGKNLTGDPYYTSGKRVVMVLPAKSAPDFPARLFLSTIDHELKKS
jgi:hypothetical protein